MIKVSSYTHHLLLKLYRLQQFCILGVQTLPMHAHSIHLRKHSIANCIEHWMSLLEGFNVGRKRFYSIRCSDDFICIWKNFLDSIPCEACLFAFRTLAMDQMFRKMIKVAFPVNECGTTSSSTPSPLTHNDLNVMRYTAGVQDSKEED